MRPIAAVASVTAHNVGAVGLPEKEVDMRQARGRRWLGAAIGLVAALAMTACGSSDASGSAGSGNETIRIGVGIDAAYAPFFLAAEDGMFKDAGLNVKVVQFGRGGDAVQAIAGGQVEMAGNSDTTTLTLIQQNPDLRATYIYEQSGKYLKVVARPDITQASQIKKMGVVPGLSDYMARKYFEANGVALSSVKFIEADPPELPTLTKKGDVDAYLLWEPWPSQGVSLGLKELTDTGSYGYSYVHWMVTSSKWLDGHEKEAGKIADVLTKAAEITASDPDRAAKAVQAQAKIKEADAKQAIELVDWKVRGFTDDDVKSYHDQVQYFVEKGVFKQPLDFSQNILMDWYDKHTTKS
jgi:NitT/TauT family transport system substrate-binding protein